MDRKALVPGKRLRKSVFLLLDRLISLAYKGFTSPPYLYKASFAST